MKTTLNKISLQKALGFVERVTSKNTTLPILNNILLKTENGRVRLAATNLEIGISSIIGANIEGEGQVAIPGKIFSDCIRTIQSDTVELSLEGDTLTVRAGDYTTTILCFDAAEYPIIPKVSQEKPYHLDAKQLCNLFLGVVDSIATSESRPELAGAFMRCGEQGVTVAATDGFRLAERSIAGSFSPPVSVIIPRGTIIELLRSLSDVDGQVAVSIGDNQIAFTSEDVEIVSRIIDGKYPDYKKVIPEKYLSKALIRKGDIENATKVAALFSSSISDVHMECQEQQLVMSAKNSSKGQASIKVQANLKGEPFAISMNYHYLFDGLKVIDTDKVVLEFTGNGGPFILRPNNETKEVVYVIMPLRN